MTELDTGVAQDRLQALLMERASAALAARRPGIPVRADRDAPAPLSSVQAGLWFLAQLAPDSAAYHVPVLLRMSGALDAAALVRAVRALTERHEVLRTVFLRDGDGPVGVLVSADRIPVSTVDITEDGLASAVAEELARPFRLDEEPPMRGVLYVLGPTEHLLALTLHHIAVDGWSRDLLLADLAALYAAETDRGPVPALPRLQYADVTAWDLDERDGAEASAELAWWAAQLAGVDGVVELPTDRPRPAVVSWAGAAVPVEIPAEVVERVGALAADAGASPFMVLLAAWQALLARLSGSEDIVVGVPEFGRHHPDAERVVGCFMNTLAMRVDLGGAPTGRELVDRVRETVLGAFAHHRTPFERIVDRLAPDRGLSATPVVQVMLSVLDSPADVPEFDGLDVTPVDPVVRVAKLDLNLTLTRHADTYRGELTFRTDLFDRSTAARIARWYVTMLAGVAAEPDRSVGAVPLDEVPGPAISGPRKEFPSDVLLHGLVDRWIAERPDAVAVVGQDRTLTYAQLDDAANRLAHRLIAAGVGTEEPVGVFAERGADLVVALLAVLRAGGAYVPLDSSYPDERIADMLDSVGAEVVLADRALAPRMADRTVLVIDDPADELGPVLREVRQDHLAYIIFTSGSTGRPKGVAVEHRNITHYLYASLDALDAPAAGGRSFALVSTHAADNGLTNVFGALVTGGTIHLLDREVALDPAAFADYLDRHAVDVIKMVPSQLELLASQGDIGRVLPRRMIILGGEACPWTLVDRIRAARPELAVEGRYGPTETTVSVLGWAVRDVPAELRSVAVPTGLPLANSECFVVDAAGRPVPAGLPGELWIAGPGVARGYLGRPEETAARFVPDPVTGEKRCYRTGDRVRINSAGLVEFLGRIDDQVKVRGFRVEPGEVAAALRARPGVVEAVVLAVGEPATRRLVAWITTDKSTVDVTELRTAVRAVLPDYMVPAAIVVLDAFPLTPSGKVNRAALPEPETRAAGTGRAPATEAELLVAEIWSAVLARTEISAEDDFFALGGHSMAATRVTARLREVLDVPVPVRAVFDRPVLADFAEAVEALLMTEFAPSTEQETAQ
ncbi:amino acid adenylation domain-containing protein [Solihabitans fulvus]|uniref:Amino acid adenylation domain-containing protein n=1 Tax=Solihabitans fulvus TaxID=1892852 RepID=A0A5B2XFM4_9PSEU|nr:non-ribosomal peptide synthetase [Solihabitans fulvus]KAA2261602.1 amino acid adenylation domain-containing protein [Solihabitans fulvus]